jgi:hypothetical protein
MKAAKMSNEARAYLMGHSIGKVPGRPVHGNSLDLTVRALLQEMVLFLSANWEPWPITELRSEIDRIAEDQGFRVNKRTIFCGSSALDVTAVPRRAYALCEMQYLGFKP